MEPPRPRSSLRAGALMGAGALLLHEARYLLTWGEGADRALAAQGHAYLDSAMLVAVALFAAGLAQVLRRLGGRRAEGGRRPRGRWLVASSALLVIYVTQETAEGLLDAGHPGGLAGVFGHGGLVAIPLALAIGGLITSAEGGARRVLAAPSRLAIPAPAPAAWPLPGPAVARVRRAVAMGLAGLARRLAGRAPPRAAA